MLDLEQSISQIIMKHPHEQDIAVLPQGERLKLPGPPHLQSMSTHRYHVLIALFDSKSGKRITDARVTATVSIPGVAEKKQRLRPMHMEGAMNYGAYFLLPSPGQYNILLDIRRPGAKRSIRASFIYTRPRA